MGCVSLRIDLWDRYLGQTKDKLHSLQLRSHKRLRVKLAPDFFAST